MNHRMGLGDAALVKDNHVAAAGGIAAAIRAVRAAAPGLPLEVECDNLDQVARGAGRGRRARSCSTTWAWLTCAPPWPWPGRTRRPGSRPAAGCGWRRPGRWRETGVDFIAVGALTHSSPALDLGLDLLP